MALNPRRAALQFLALLPLPIIVGLIIMSVKRPPVAPLPAGSSGKARGASAGSTRLVLPTKLASGWTLKGKQSRYNSKTLYDRINGAAPAYIRAGYVGSVSAEYVHKGFKDSVMVDAYDMGSTARALGMYASERDRSYTFCDMADEGYLASGSLNLWSGRIYIKLAGFEEGEAMDAGLKALASDMVKTLPVASDHKKTTAGLALLPAAGRLDHGGGYSHAAFADVKGLEGVFTGAYGSTAEGASNPPITIFAVKAVDGGAAGERLVKALAYFKGFNGTMDQRALEGGGKEIVIRGEGAAQLLVQRGALLGGALDLTNKGDLVLARKLLAEFGKDVSKPAAGGAEK